MLSHNFCQNVSARLLLAFLMLNLINYSSAEAHDNDTKVFQGYAIYEATNLSSTNELDSRKFCIVDIVWNRDILDQAYPLVDYSTRRLCRDELDGNVARAYFVFRFDTTECSIATQLRTFEKLYPNAVGLILATRCDVDYDSYLNVSSSTPVRSYSIAMISIANAAQMVQYANVTLRKIETDKPAMLFVVVFGCAALTVIAGAWWSGRVRKQIYDRDHFLEVDEEHGKQIAAEEEEEGDEDALDANRKNEKAKKKQKNKEVEPAFVQMSACTVMILITFMVTSLMLLYLFYAYVVYIIITIFMLASVLALFHCLTSLALFCLPSPITSLCFEIEKFWKKSQPAEYFKIRLFHLPVLALSVAIPLTWLLIRFRPEAWIVQDILGIVFCINMLRMIRLPNFKICIFILFFLFIYDIFFVFITPLLTSKGKSIMVEVATGGSSDDNGSLPLKGCPTRQIEALPMLLKIPQSLFDSNKDVCFERYSMLGFGDILVPGLLVSYCHAFDRIRGRSGRLIYYLTSVVAYGFGLVFTYLGMWFMNGSAQPALLYLVPSLTVPVMIIACLRGEFRQFWIGPEVEERTQTGTNGMAVEPTAGHVSSAVQAIQN